MRDISLLRFNTLAGYVRDYRFYLSIEELEWYESADGRLLGVVARDRTDNDFAYVILGRDRLRRYRAVAIEHSFPSRKKARQQLRVGFAKFAKASSSVFFQGDEKGNPIEVFRPVVSLEKQSKAFVALSTRGTYPATRVIEEMMHWYEDIDGNFLEQFQSTGFDARLWELYLFATFIEAGLALDRSYSAPDFLCIGPYGKFFVEATTAIPLSPQLIRVR